MKLQDHYDCIVLGDSPASLFSAALLAKWDLSVLCLPLFPSFGIQTSPTGMVWDPERNRVPWSPLLKKWLTTDYPRATLLGFEEGDQLLTPNARLLCPSLEVEWMAEASKEWGSDWMARYGFADALTKLAPSLRDSWRKFPGEHAVQERDRKRKGGAREPLGGWREATRYTSAKKSPWTREDALLSDLCTLHPSPEAYETFTGIHALLSGTDSVNPSLQGVLELAALQPWVEHMRGGMTAFRAFLKTVAKRHGAHLPEGMKVHRLFVEDGQFIGVQIENRGRLIGARGGILGCSIMQAKKLFFFAGRESHVKLQPVPEPRGWIFTVAIQVKPQGIPPGTTRTMLWSEEGASSLEIELASVEDYHRVDAPEALVFLRTRLPFRSDTLSPEVQSRVAARMFRKARDLLPFLEYSIISMYPELRPLHQTEIEKHTQLRMLYPFLSLEEIPENLRVFPTEMGSAFGAAGFETGIEKLSLATHESYPELGPVSGFVAAIQGINRLLLEDNLLPPEEAGSRWTA